VLAACAALASPPARAAGACMPPRVTTQSTQNSGEIDFNLSLRPIGSLQAVMLFVDYPDRPGTATPQSVFDRHVPRAAQWLHDVSYGRMSLTVTPFLQWLRMPSTSTQYMSRANPSFDAQRRLIQDAVNAADSSVDFSPYGLIYVVSPAGSGIDYSPGFTPNSPFFGVRADGNTFTHGATLGNDFYVSDVYGANVLIHETAHTFGLPDLYDFDRTVFPYSTFVGDWDLMGNLDVGAGFVAWQRLQLGWIDAGQVACVASAGAGDVRLSPMEQAGGTKAVIVQTGATEFTVAENRQATAEDALVCDSGMLVTTVDATVESGHGPIRVQPAALDDGTKSVSRCGPLYNAAFAVGDATYVGASVRMNVQCKVGADLVVRVAYEVPLGPEPSALCVPGAPAGVTAVAGDGSAVVSFTPPAGDVPVLWYTATASPGGQSASAVAGPITVGGLQNGLEYTFTVTASSGAGAGPTSAASSQVVPAGASRVEVEPPSEAARAAVPDFTPPSNARPPRPGLTRRSAPGVAEAAEEQDEQHDDQQ
jgi:M6 family metalloprotease-like protein